MPEPRADSCAAWERLFTLAFLALTSNAKGSTRTGQRVEQSAGIYRVDIACDGTLTEFGRVLPAQLPHAMVLLDQDRVFLASSEVLGSAPSEEAHLLDWTDPPTRIASAEALGDDDAIMASAAVTPDGKLGLLGDDSMMAGERVGVVRIDGDVLSFEQVLASVPAPVSMVASPNHDAAVQAGFPKRRDCPKVGIVRLCDLSVTCRHGTNIAPPRTSVRTGTGCAMNHRLTQTGRTKKTHLGGTAKKSLVQCLMW